MLMGRDVGSLNTNNYAHAVCIPPAATEWQQRHHCKAEFN